MGWASERMIENHNALYESDEQYAADYDESMRIGAALEAGFFKQEAENEKQIDWFEDLLIDHSGRKIELPEPAATATGIPFSSRRRDS